MSVGAPASLRAPVKEGDVLDGKYVVELVLGVGGMGVVVAARHKLLGGRVALKFVLPELATSTQVVDRFMKEAQAATRITSEHIARVTDVGTLDGRIPYMVMEFLEGQDLGGLLAQRGPLPLEEAVDYVLQALQAVAEAHTKGIVHRDLKPTNLFLTKRADGTPLIKVLDFGIAKAVRPDAVGFGSEGDLTGSQATIGSPFYMSPQQIKSSRSVDARTDVWAMGVILHELLTNTLPFAAESTGALLAAILTEEPTRLRVSRPDLPQAVEQAILGCLEKDVELRVPSALALATALAPFGSADARLSLSRIVGISGRDSGGRAADSAASGRPAGEARSAPRGATNGSWGGTHGGSSSRSRGWPFAVVGLVLGATALFLRHGSAPPTPLSPVLQSVGASAASPPVEGRVAEVAELPARTVTPVAAPASSAPLGATSASASAMKAVSQAPARRPAAAYKPAPAAPTQPKTPLRPKGALDGLIDQR